MRRVGHAAAYSVSSAAGDLTFRKRAWFSAAMTQRSIQLPTDATAHRAARSAAIASKRIDIAVLNVALAALVLVVVVLITTPTGAG